MKRNYIKLKDIINFIFSKGGSEYELYELTNPVKLVGEEASVEAVYIENGHLMFMIETKKPSIGYYGGELKQSERKAILNDLKAQWQ